MSWKELSTIILLDVSYLTYKLYFGSLKSEEDQDIAERVSSIAYGLQSGISNSKVIACYDRTPVHRIAIYPEYKAGRKKDESTEKVKSHIANSVYWMNQKGIFHYHVDGHEADDVIASFCSKSVKAGLNVKILSSDKDMFPLLEYKRTEIFKNYHCYGNENGESFLDLSDQVTIDYVKKKYGVHPSQWVDFRCLSGDVSDNIHGAKGWGEKKASAFLNMYRSLQNALSNWDIVSQGLTESRRESLKNFLDSDYHKMKLLFTLEDCLPVTLKQKVSTVA